MVYRGPRADGSRNEKGTALKPEEQSGEPASNNFIRSIIRTLTVWYDAEPQESGQPVGSKVICRKACLTSPKMAHLYSLNRRTLRISGRRLGPISRESFSGGDPGS